MNEEKFYYGAIDFWKENKELDSLHLLNKFIEEKYLPKLDIIKEVREYIEHYETIRGYYEYQELGYDEYNYDEDLKQELLEILDKVDKENK